MDTARYCVALIVSVSMIPAVLVWTVIHPFADKWRRVGPIGAYIFIIAFVVTGTFLLWLNRDWILAYEYGLNKSLSILAAIIMCVGVLLRILWRRVLRPRTILGLPEIFGRNSSDELVTEGIYSYVRHPRYLEVGMALAAAAFFSNYLAAYIVLAAYMPLIYIVVLLEERELRDRFGKAYEEYCSRVPRFFPKIRSRKSS